MVRLHFKGMMAPPFTPFKVDGSLNLEVVKTYAKYLREAGVTGVFVNGTAGEGMSMTVEERKAVGEAWLSCRNDVPTVILQCGAGCLKDTQELARHAESHGANGVAVLPSLYDKPSTADDLVDYMVEVAKACPFTPLFYYHYPMKTAVKISMSEFLEKGVKKIPNLSGIKFTDLDVSGEGKKCLQVAASGNMTVFNGFDEKLQEALSLGFTCSINASFNFLPHLGASIFKLMADGETEEALEKQKELTNCFRVIFRQSGGLNSAFMKAACTVLTGLQVGPTRLPVKMLTDEMMAILRSDLEKAGCKVH